MLKALGDSVDACGRRGVPDSPVNTWRTPERAVEPREHALLATARGVVAIGRRVLILLARLDRSLRTIDSLEDDE